MYRVSHEFTFEMAHQGTFIKFIGQLVFKGRELNSLGTLHTEESMENFGYALNRIVGLPEYWTLEILAKSLYDNVKPLFPSLTAINLSIQDAQYRIAEYDGEIDESIDFEGITDFPDVIG